VAEQNDTAAYETSWSCIKHRSMMQVARWSGGEDAGLAVLFNSRL